MKNSLNKVTVSIVSHGHGDMVWELVRQLTPYDEVVKILVTLNIPELAPVNLSEKVLLIQNNKPKGFGENHNAAFYLVDSDFYCVLNPDIEFTQNPFPALYDLLDDQLCGVCAPVIVDGNGVTADTMREHLTPWILIKRVLNLSQGVRITNTRDCKIFSDWIAGMFMLFRARAFDRVGGFDQRYFMYCEDADICRRMWKIGYQVSVCLTVSVIHRARRASHSNLQHFIWHLQSLFSYFLQHKK